MSAPTSVKPVEPSGLISKIGLPGAPGRPTVELFKSLKQTYRAKSIDFLVSLIAAHLADGVLEHYVLLEEMVDGHLILCIVVLRTLEEEGSGSAECRNGLHGLRGR